MELRVGFERLGAVFEIGVAFDGEYPMGDGIRGEQRRQHPSTAHPVHVVRDHHHEAVPSALAVGDGPSGTSEDVGVGLGVGRRRVVGVGGGDWEEWHLGWLVDCFSRASFKKKRVFEIRTTASSPYFQYMTLS